MSSYHVIRIAQVIAHSIEFKKIFKASNLLDVALVIDIIKRLFFPLLDAALFIFGISHVLRTRYVRC